MQWTARRVCVGSGRQENGTQAHLGGYIWEGKRAERLSRKETAVIEFQGEPRLYLHELRSLYRDLCEWQRPILFDQEGNPISSL